MSDRSSNSSPDHGRYNTTQTYPGRRTPTDSYSSSRRPHIINVEPDQYLYTTSTSTTPHREIVHDRERVREREPRNRQEPVIIHNTRHIANHAEHNPDLVELGIPEMRPKQSTPYPSHIAPIRVPSTHVPKPKPKPKTYDDGRKSPGLSTSTGPKKRPLEIVEPGSDDFQQKLRKELGSESRISVQLRMPDIFSSFMKNELQKGDSLWDLVVLTGDPSLSQTSSKSKGLWSTTCGSYIAESWPGASDRLQQLLKRLEVDSDMSTSLDLSSPIYGDLIVTVGRHILTTGGTELAVGFRGKLESMLDVLQGVSWLFATLQSWEKNEPASCTVSWRRQPQQSRDNIVPGSQFDFTYNLHISDLYPLPVPEKSSCWKPLFPSTPCSTGFAARPRPAAMQGVEMQFELLCLLCGLDYMTDDGKGLLLFGPKSLVYPVRAEGNCVQWHLQHCEPDNEDQHEITGDRIHTLDLESLCGPFTRHFLGLWSKSIVTLGTDLQKYDKIEWSGAKELPQESVRDGYSYGASVSIKGVLSLNWNQNYKIANTRKPVFITSITNRLHSCMNEPVMLYSPSEARAWMVPFMSVFWHLLRSQADTRKRSGYSIPACKKSGNGGKAAFDCFDTNRNKSTRKPARNQDPIPDDEKETISEFAEDLWRTLDVAMRQTCISKKFFRDSILGFELVAIATCRPTMPLKSHYLNFAARHSWAPLLSRVRLTFFYEGLLDPILPADDMDFAGACGRSTWRVVPKGHNLLTVSLPCLAFATADLNGGRERLTCVAPGKCWSTTKDPGTLFSMCSKTSSHTCDRILQINTEGRGADPLIYKDDAAKDGAVMFRFKHKFEDIVGTQTSSPLDNRYLRPDRHSTSPLSSGRSSPRGSHHSSPSRVSSDRADSGYSSASRPSHVSRPSTGSEASSVAVVSASDDEGIGSITTSSSSKSKKGKKVTRVGKRGGVLYKERYRPSS